ncbi:MAG: hypothetical protein JSS98_00885, partial [Bacteroidetes bacterium]|nr:hypothetical protein [Bacteroidota bacterium]
RLGRFLSVDPLFHDYPWYTPYQFAGNKPIEAIDLNGTEEFYINQQNRVKYRTELELSIKKEQNERRVNPFSSSLPINAYATRTQTTISQNLTPYNTEYKQELRNEQQTIKNLKGATMDPWAGELSIRSYVTAQEYINGVVNNGKGVVEGIKEGNGWQIAGNALGLALSLSPAIEIPVSALPARLVRVIPEETFAGATNLGRATETEAFVTTPIDIKGLQTSEQIAKKLSLYRSDGTLIKGPFRLIEFDTPSEGLAVPFNRTNPGFINGGKTLGGANEYVLPNLKLTKLKNVTYKVIK